MREREKERALTERLWPATTKEMSLSFPSFAKSSSFFSRELQKKKLTRLLHAEPETSLVGISGAEQRSLAPPHSPLRHPPSPRAGRAPSSLDKPPLPPYPQISIDILASSGHLPAHFLPFPHLISEKLLRISETSAKQRAEKNTPLNRGFQNSWLRIDHRNQNNRQRKRPWKGWRKSMMSTSARHPDVTALSVNSPPPQKKQKQLLAGVLGSE